MWNKRRHTHFDIIQNNQWSIYTWHSFIGCKQEDAQLSTQISYLSSNFYIHVNLPSSLYQTSQTVQQSTKF